MEKLKRVTISWQLLLEMMTKGWSVEHCECIEGLPLGAEYIRGYTKQLCNTVETPDVVLVFTHESFEPVSPGKEIPELTPVFQVKYPEKE